MLSIATKVDDLEWPWTSIYCSVIRVMRVVTKRMRLESRGICYKVALYFSYQHTKFDDIIIFITLCRTVVSTTTKVNRKTWNSPAHHTKMAEPIIAWITKSGSLPPSKISSGIFYPCIGEIVFTRLLFFVFLFVGSSDKLAPRPLHRFWRLKRQMASFRARMCLLGAR